MLVCSLVGSREGNSSEVYFPHPNSVNEACAANCKLQVQGSYYSEQEARLGHFPNDLVEETHALMPAEVEVKTTVSKLFFNFKSAALKCTVHHSGLRFKEFMSNAMFFSLQKWDFYCY